MQPTNCTFLVKDSAAASLVSCIETHFTFSHLPHFHVPPSLLFYLHRRAFTPHPWLTLVVHFRNTLLPIRATPKVQSSPPCLAVPMLLPAFHISTLALARVLSAFFHTPTVAVVLTEVLSGSVGSVG